MVGRASVLLLALVGPGEESVFFRETQNTPSRAYFKSIKGDCAADLGGNFAGSSLYIEIQINVYGRPRMMGMKDVKVS